MTTTPTYNPPPRSGATPTSFSEAADKKWVTRIVESLGPLFQGKMNAVLQLTLTASSATTTVTDARIGYSSALILVPLTAHAAASQYAAPYVLPSAQKSGEVTLNHSNTADTDKDFLVVIIG